jgi:hypothetical protein
MTKKPAISLAFVLAVVASVSVGCTAERAALTEAAPDVDADALDVADFGTSYNGWSIWAEGTSWRKEHWNDFSVGFTKSSGSDATRGGGGCLVRQVPGWTCSTDSQCPSAAPGWGYCVSGQCYERPGSQADWCALAPNNAPNASYAKGVSDNGYFSFSDQTYVLTCLTKTAGPNTACGGTNTSLYMRAVTFVDRGS